MSAKGSNSVVDVVLDELARAAYEEHHTMVAMSWPPWQFLPETNRSVWRSVVRRLQATAEEMAARAVASTSDEVTSIGLFAYMAARSDPSADRDRKWPAWSGLPVSVRQIWISAATHTENLVRSSQGPVSTEESFAQRFRCIDCDAVFLHPDGECKSVAGGCEHLVSAGWLPVWIRVERNSNGTHLLSKGGWLCPVHPHGEDSGVSSREDSGPEPKTWVDKVPSIPDEVFLARIECALANPHGEPFEEVYVPELVRRLKGATHGARAYMETIDGVREALGQEATHYLVVADDVRELVEAVELCASESGCRAMTVLRKLRER